ncbi:putative amidoligase enzyme-domain-containing protein [Chaetomium fimeti]|uniref:Amidoligase enzyme-domain-containing protein n=1 Tax=Chaetomium fimeti TaxID=1854472 RepID=A0AAE0HJC2_9PEZI|nr:putative amidoligase enzyme-domain-containing protein [Chaetomium fimeti]
MSRNLARAAPPPAAPRPLFGVEIEVFVRLLPDVEDRIVQAGYDYPDSLPDYWLQWDENLENDSRNQRSKHDQRKRVGKAIMGIIDSALGPRNGWKCESDESLKESLLTEPHDTRRWWGIEIISPPMSVSRKWQKEIETIFDVVGESFDFWTNENCACHVHVSPGPTTDYTYSLTELNQMAKGAYYWEDALCDLLPIERRDNRYAKPNYTYFAHHEYMDVLRDGWGPVFDELDYITSQGQAEFLYTMSGGRTQTRYVSTNFDPFTSYGTVELRRQAGAASATTVIHRVLLAVTFHVSCMRFNFSQVRNARGYPSGEALIKELGACIKLLPDTCLGSRFLNWLKYCQETYADDRPSLETVINRQERSLRNGGDVPTAGGGGARRGGGGTSRGGGASSPASSRGPSRQTVVLPERTRAPPAPAPAPAAPRQRRQAREESPRPLARRRTQAVRDDPPARRTAPPPAPAPARRQTIREESPRPLARRRNPPPRDDDRRGAPPPRRRAADYDDWR